MVVSWRAGSETDACTGLPGWAVLPVHNQPIIRKLDGKRRLVWVGRYLGGRPSGVCWSFVSGGGMVVGKVDSDGKLTGDEVAFCDCLDPKTPCVTRWPTSTLTTSPPS